MEDGLTYSREVAEGKDAEEGGFAACTVADYDKFPVEMNGKLGFSSISTWTVFGRQAI